MSVNQVLFHSFGVDVNYCPATHSIDGTKERQNMMCNGITPFVSDRNLVLLEEAK